MPNSLHYQRLFVSLQHENPPSLSTMLKCVGRFCFYGYMATRIPFVKTYQNRGGRWQVDNAEERECGCRRIRGWQCLWFHLLHQIGVD